MIINSGGTDDVSGCKWLSLIKNQKQSVNMFRDLNSKAVINPISSTSSDRELRSDVDCLRVQLAAKLEQRGFTDNAG